MAAPQGFEPRYADPESAVLPLNEGAVGMGCPSGHPIHLKVVRNGGQCPKGRGVATAPISTGPLNGPSTICIVLEIPFNLLWIALPSALFRLWIPGRIAEAKGSRPPGIHLQIVALSILVAVLFPGRLAYRDAPDLHGACRDRRFPSHISNCLPFLLLFSR